MKDSTTITKEKIVEQLKNQLGLSALLCEEITCNVFSEILALTKSNKKTTLQNFGTWSINHKEARPGLNIHTGDAVQIEPRNVLRFAPSKSLKEKINL